MERFNFVFVVLTYRNHMDLYDFKNSLVNILGKYKVVVVNSFYDNESMLKIKTICKENDFEFLNVENKGYSYGNNIGIDFIRKNYKYDFIIISNPDIEIQKLDYRSLVSYDGCIIGPQIINRIKKNQNPVYYTRQSMVEKIQVFSIKRKKYYITYLAALINKINKGYHSIIKRKNTKKIYVYALHGSFMIFSEKVIDMLKYKPFDDNMFLFAEEDYLAYVASENKIRMVYDKNNIVMHKEDGSMRLSNIDLKKIALNSLEYLYALKSSKL